MLSNHYGWLYQAKFNWLVLVLLMLAGALIRHFFVARHKAKVKGVTPPWPFFAAGCGVLVGLAIMLVPPPRPAAVAQPPVSFAQVQAVIQQRCVMCHNANLQNKGVALDSEALIRQHAQQLYQQAVVMKLMPLNNATQITEDERSLLGRWVQAGMP